MDDYYSEVPTGFTLVRTCGACPEQYDLRDAEGEMAGYFRLRHGFLAVTVPDVGGKVVYSHTFEDGWLGTFPTDGSRAKHMRRGIKKVLAARR